MRVSRILEEKLWFAAKKVKAHCKFFCAFNLKQVSKQLGFKDLGVSRRRYQDFNITKHKCLHSSDRSDRDAPDDKDNINQNLPDGRELCSSPNLLMPSKSSPRSMFRTMTEHLKLRESFDPPLHSSRVVEAT